MNLFPPLQSELKVLFDSVKVITSLDLRMFDISNIRGEVRFWVLWNIYWFLRYFIRTIKTVKNHHHIQTTIHIFKVSWNMLDVHASQNKYIFDTHKLYICFIVATPGFHLWLGWHLHWLPLQSNHWWLQAVQYSCDKNSCHLLFSQ